MNDQYNPVILESENYDDYELISQKYDEISTVVNTTYDKASSLVDNVNNLTSSLNMVADKAQNIANVYSDCVKLRQKTKQIEAWSEEKMARTIAKYKTCQQYLTQSFGERNSALQKNYDVLDNAMETGDRELIIEALRNISGIVTTSPLQDLQKLIELYEDEDQTFFDF